MIETPYSMDMEGTIPIIDVVLVAVVSTRSTTKVSKSFPAFCTSDSYFEEGIKN